MIVIKGMQGLGDNIYQRAFIKSLLKSSDVLLETPWPEIYEDLPGVNFLKPHTKLRTQKKNLERATDVKWHPPYFGNAKAISYGRAGIVKGMRGAFGVDCAPFDLPKFDSPVEGEYVVIRPVTTRKEWIATARNPDPKYIYECSEILMAKGYKVVSIADLSDDLEWLEGPEPMSSICYHRGELTVRQLLGLVQGAKFVVGGIGWLLPAAIASKVPGWFVYGGQGAFNAPELLTDSDRMDLSKIGYALPDQFCRCALGAHNCNKRITGHADQFTQWLGKIASLER